MKIAIDLDGTLNDMHSVWMAMYNADYDDNLVSSDVKSWDTHKYVKPECGKSVYKYLNRPEVYLQAPIQPGAFEVVRQWVAGGDTVLVVSTCAKGSFDAKREWLKEKFPFLPTGNFIAAENKAFVPADVLIDDGYHNLRSYPALDGGLILYAQAWNLVEWQERGSTDGITRAIGWRSVKYAVEKLRDSYGSYLHDGAITAGTK